MTGKAFLILLIVVAAIAWALLRVRRIWLDNFAHRNDGDVMLLAELQKARVEAPETVLVLDPPQPRQKPVAPLVPTPATPAPPKKPQPLVDAALRVVFYLLKIELADHEILARVDPQTLLGPGAPRLPIDAVVCRRDFQPVAVVILLRQNAEDAAREQLASALGQHGFNVLTWDIKALPARGKVRQAVLGSTT